MLPGSWKSALVPFFAGIPRRTGFVRELRFGLLNDIRRLDKRALPMTVQRFWALGAAPGDEFGYTTSTCGERTVVGAPFADPIGQDSGFAYLFEHDADCNANGIADA